MTASTGVDAADTGGNVDTGGVEDAGAVSDVVEAGDVGGEAKVLVVAAGVVPKVAGEAVPVVFVDANALKDGGKAVTVAGAAAVAACAAPVDVAGVPIGEAAGARFDGAVDGVSSALDVAVKAVPDCADVAAVARDSGVVGALGARCDSDALKVVAAAAGAADVAMAAGCVAVGLEAPIANVAAATDGAAA